jgi:hypothetical protein
LLSQGAVQEQVCQWLAPQEQAGWHGSEQEALLPQEHSSPPHWQSEEQSSALEQEGVLPQAQTSPPQPQGGGSQEPEQSPDAVHPQALLSVQEHGSLFWQGEPH